jgi:UDP-N-acetyl-2-amino-2-deoxyglucuronate dehydrogenase
MKNFALVGAAGYVAPRHMKAIAETKNNLVAALDKSDSVGIIDSYFPEAEFFVEFERFDRYVEKLRRIGEEKKVHYVSITSPNYLHDAHARFALRVGADAICEKPIVLNPWNLDALEDIERETGRRIWPILQLRLHPVIKILKDEVDTITKEKKADIEITYITSRGRWYLASWKGELAKSGGLATNIGVHFFDMLLWLFGKTKWNVVHLSQPTRGSGYLELENARVKWFLSLDRADLPREALVAGKTTYRSITINGKELEFSEGFTDLHTLSYEAVLKGEGFRLEDTRPSIEAVFEIRNAKELAPKGDYHPFLRMKSR